MKNRYLLLLFLIGVFKLSLAGDTLIKARYKVEKVKNYTTLRIEFTIDKLPTCDTCKNLFEKFFQGKKSVEGPGLTELTNSIRSELLKNKNIEQHVELPAYINQIIDLIKQEKKKKAAREIYIENNLASVVSTSDQSSTSYEGGKKTKDQIIRSMTYSLDVKGPTTVMMPALKFVYSEVMYTIEPLEINL